MCCISKCQTITIRISSCIFFGAYKYTIYGRDERARASFQFLRAAEQRTNTTWTAAGIRRRGEWGPFGCDEPCNEPPRNVCKGDAPRPCPFSLSYTVYTIYTGLCLRVYVYLYGHSMLLLHHAALVSFLYADSSSFPIYFLLPFCAHERLSTNFSILLFGLLRSFGWLSIGRDVVTVIIRSTLKRID